MSDSIPNEQDEIYHLWLNVSVPYERARCVQYRIADGTLMDGTLVSPYAPVNSIYLWVNMGEILDVDRDYIKTYRL